MIKKVVSITLLLSISFTYSLFGVNIGLLIMATGKYISYTEPLITSAEKYFCKNHHVTYFVFTDGNAPVKENVVSIYQQKLGWPFDTLMRFHIYATQYNLLKGLDYLFACDADMLFVDNVGDEILEERVATTHPGYIGQNYYAGGFWGGTFKEVMNISNICAYNIDEELRHGIIAQWHDETHWNRYCKENPPTKILSPSYCYPENCSWFTNTNYPPKLVAKYKNHHEMRSDD